MTIPTAETTVSFGRFEFDLKTAQLTRSGVRIRLAQQPLQVLSLLLERPGEVVSREEFRQKLWPGDVFVDFDHGLNKSVQKLRDALGDSAEGSRYVETIPRMGYRFVAPVHVPASVPGSQEVAEPQVVVSAVSATSTEDEREQKLPAGGRLGGRWFRWLVAAGCVVVLAGVAGWWIRKEKLAAAPIHSVAVIPLENLTGDAGKEYIADGMTDELTTMLAKNSTLKVTSRTSMMQYKGVHRALPEIAREVGVDGILEGSISGAGDRVHLTIQLIQAPSDTHVWAESYDRDAKDVASLPREASLTIAKKLDRVIPGSAAPRYVSPEAHDAYLHGRYLSTTLNHSEQSGTYGMAGKYFQKAIDLQPDYADAWSGLADFYGGEAAGSLADPQPALEKELTAASKAVELDDSNARGHLSLAGAYLFHDWNWTLAEREINRAIALDPGFADAYSLRSDLMSILGRHTEAIAAAKEAAALAPSERPSCVVEAYMNARQFDLALKANLDRLESNPQDADLHFDLSWIYLHFGKEREAIEEKEKGFQLSGDTDSVEGLRKAYRRGGYKGTLLWRFNQNKKDALSGYVSPIDQATIAARLGRRDEAIGYLEQAFQQHTPTLLGIQNSEPYDFLRADPRFQSIVKRIGFPPAH